MNLFQKVWGVLTQGARQLIEYLDQPRLIDLLQTRWLALDDSRMCAESARVKVSVGLKQPNQSSKVRYLNEKIKAYRTEQLQIEALLRDMK